MKSLRTIVILTIILGLFFIGCHKEATTQPTDYWNPKPEATQAKISFESLPQLLQEYSMNNPGAFPEITVMADSSNLHCSDLTVKYLGTTIYEASGAQFGHQIMYGYFGNKNIVIISTYRNYYASVSIDPADWKCFIDGEDQDETFLNMPVSHITAPPTNCQWSRNRGWTNLDAENPMQSSLKQLRIPEIRYCEDRQILFLRFGLFQSYHVNQWSGDYWTEYEPSSNHLSQFGVDEWR